MLTFPCRKCVYLIFMNVTRISYINFTGKIIDSHVHIGKHDGGDYRKNDLDIFVKSQLPNKDTV